MVWGAIWLTPNGRVGRSPLIIMERDPDAAKNGYSASSYTETLTHGLLPQYCPGQIFIHNNAPIYNAKYTKEFLKKHGIQTIEWPLYLLNFNSIEYLQWAFKKLVYKLHFKFIFYIGNLYKLKPIYSPSILRLIFYLLAFCHLHSLKPFWHRFNKAPNKAIRQLFPRLL